MKIANVFLDALRTDDNYGKLVACASYMSRRISINEENAGITVHEQVAQLFCMGLDVDRIAKTTGFEKETVTSAIKDIVATVYIQS